MSQIQIGGLYKLDIPVDEYDNAINWINRRSRKLFANLKELDGKKVIVRTRTRTDSSVYIVTLLNFPLDTFYTSKKYLVIEKPPDPIPCSCDLHILVNRGCQCGAFKKEKEIEKKSDLNL